MKKHDSNKALRLLNILTRYSDKAHPLKMSDIIKYMEKEGMGCSEDSIGRYILQLRNELGVEIVSTMGRKASYYLGDRLMDKSELKLTVDAVKGSNFIDESTSKSIIKKLKGTLSKYESKELDRNITGISIDKSDNRKICKNVEILQHAMDENVQVEFDYMEWNRNKTMEIRKEGRICLNPWAILWTYDRYFLYGYKPEHQNGVFQERHYRVDKMENISLTENKRRGRDQFESFDVDMYVSRRIGLFPGGEELLVIKAANHLVGSFIDQFGKNIYIAPSDEKGSVIIIFKAVVSPMLIGWIIGLGKAQILKPQSAVDKIKAVIARNSEIYELNKL